LIDKYELNRQYPNDVTYLLKIYKDQGTEKMIEKLEELKKNKKMQPHTLNELSYVFLQHDPELSVKMLQENIALHPDDGISYYILGIMSFEMQDYLAARELFNKSKELNFTGVDNNFSVDLYLKKCNLKINDMQSRKTFKVFLRR
jgi:tetratricopeptide (TPR) repeat protein